MIESDLLKLSSRLLLVLHNSPYELDAKVKFINGVHHGTVEWTGTHHTYRRRWVHQTMQSIVSEFTACVMVSTYGDGLVSTPDSARDEPIVIQYEWLDYPQTFYFGFQNARQYRNWMEVHSDWLTWVPLRGLR
jgi:hypothetical protein